jgi:hypothetical protein
MAEKYMHGLCGKRTFAVAALLHARSKSQRQLGVLWHKEEL